MFWSPMIPGADPILLPLIENESESAEFALWENASGGTLSMAIGRSLISSK